MQIHNCEQGSDEWHQLRLGKITASEAATVLSKGIGRKTYMYQLAAGRLTGIVPESYSNATMERGLEVEPQARQYYEVLNSCKIEQVGFVELNEWIGCSPDGLVNNNGLVEIKCPNTSTHIGYIDKDKMPTKYIPQVQFQLAVTNREFCDFVSFDPRLASNPFFCIRVKRDEKYIITLRAAVDKFAGELKDLITKINQSPF